MDGPHSEPSVKGTCHGDTFLKMASPLQLSTFGPHRTHCKCGLSVSVYVLCKTDEPIEMPFGGENRGPEKLVPDVSEVQIQHGKKTYKAAMCLAALVRWARQVLAPDVV